MDKKDVGFDTKNFHIKELDEEELQEAFCGYSDRKIIISMFEVINLEQGREILRRLIKDWGERL